MEYTLAEMKKAIFNAVKPIFIDKPNVIKHWEHIALNMTDSETKNGTPESSSPSFMALYLLFTYLVDEGLLKLDQIERVALQYQEQIRDVIEPYLMLNGEKESKQTLRKKQEVVQELIQNDIAKTGSSVLYHKLREAISMNRFIADNSDTPTFILKEKNVNAIAQIFPKVDDMKLAEKEVGTWENLMSEAVSKMDDLTADIFDIVSILWLQRHEMEDNYAGMIEFHSDDALELRRIQKKKNSNGIVNSYNKKDRDEVMKRIAALGSIWITIDDDQGIRLVDRQKIDDATDYKFAEMKRLFLIDSVKFAYDSKTNEPVGIYSCKIRPGEILTKYLEGAERSLGTLSLKALQYNPIKQKYHKRLTRYLSWQWRIRQRKSDYERPYSIENLITVMDLHLNSRFPMRTKETFERILDELQKDAVIKSWHYVEIDESQIGKGNSKWLEQYWIKLRVVILPPVKVRNVGNKEKKNEMEQIDTGFQTLAKIMKLENHKNKKRFNNEEKQLILNLSEDNEDSAFSDVTPQRIQQERKARDLSISKAAQEIGISHSTLSRFERGLIKKPNKSNLTSMKKWLFS